MENLGEKIHNRRIELGWSLRELSDRTGVSVSYINRIERGERKTPSYDMLIKIFSALGWDMEGHHLYPLPTNDEDGREGLVTSAELESLRMYVRDIENLIFKLSAKVKSINEILEKK